MGWTVNRDPNNSWGGGVGLGMGEGSPGREIVLLFAIEDLVFSHGLVTIVMCNTSQTQKVHKLGRFEVRNVELVQNTYSYMCI